MKRMQQFSLQVQSTDAGGRTLVNEYARCISGAELVTNRLDSPGKLTFSCIESREIAIPEGSLVRLTVDHVNMFQGYVFSGERSREGETSYVAYDQLRYLKANASYIFENMTLGQIITQIASDFGLRTGRLADTGYAFPCLIKENESCLDIIFDALTETIIQTGKIYLFFDDAGALTLMEAEKLILTTVIGEQSLATDYTYKREIDTDTYNRIKLVQKNAESGRTDVYVHEDTDTIRKWGLLQYYDEVNENLNAAQIDEMCKNYLAYYNRVLQTLTLEAIGLPMIRAGTILPVRIAAIQGGTLRLLLTEKVTHSIKDGVHTMRIEVKNFEHLGGIAVV